MLLNNAFQGLNDYWRYLLGFLVILGCYFLGQLPMTGVQLYMMSIDNTIGQDELAEFGRTMDFELFGINKNVGLILLLVMFVFAIIGLFYVVTKIHKKDFLALISSTQKIDLTRVWYGFAFWSILTIVVELVNYMMFSELYTFRFDITTFLPLLVIALLFLPIQTSFEELFFRGYILQGLVFFAKNKWIPILVSSILFGLMHATNPEVKEFGFWTMEFYYVMAGVFLAVITVLDDRMELALGVHAATNILGATLVTYSGSVLQTDTLFIVSAIKPWLMILGFMISAIIFYYGLHQKISLAIVEISV